MIKCFLTFFIYLSNSRIEICLEYPALTSGSQILVHNLGVPRQLEFSNIQTLKSKIRYLESETKTGLTLANVSDDLHGQTHCALDKALFWAAIGFICSFLPLFLPLIELHPVIAIGCLFKKDFLRCFSVISLLRGKLMFRKIDSVGVFSSLPHALSVSLFLEPVSGNILVNSVSRYTWLIGILGGSVG